MITEIYQPEKRRARRNSDFEKDFSHALKQLEAVLQLGYPENMNTLKIDQAQKIRYPEEKALHDRAALVLRVIQAISREIGHLSPDSVEHLLRSSDPRLLAGLAQASLDDAQIDRVDRLQLKGAERLQKLLESVGGSVSTQWVSEFLEISEEAVRKRAQRGHLIARRTASGNLSFPRFQFLEERSSLLPGLAKLLSETKSWDTNELIRFLLVRHEPSSSEDTPLELLKLGKIDRVLSLARFNMEQRA